ncbi:MAG: CDP-alcohol phosphatidyltransferase family protein [Streptococcaceae bacterium]|jgi:CDP-diacylglycerol--serine O-phosphatidyltransferase|nr:CDP-alcohol phosphatidyltransferase family protein [Streptococcaceae bacterium]
MKLIGKYNRSVLVTYLGVSIAILGTYFALVQSSARLALLCLVLAGICDLFDGVFARTVKRDASEKEFGVQLDSLADMVQFVFLPVAAAYSLGLDSWFHIVVYILYTLAALVRLAFFNITVDGKSNESVSHFRGLPVTYSALILPIIWLSSLFLDKTLFQSIFTIILLLIACFFVLDIKMPKPRGIFYVIFPLLALILVITLLLV